MPNRDAKQNRAILLAAVFKVAGKIRDGFKSFQGLDCKHTPRSENIYTPLEPHAENILYLSTDYEEAIDRAEIIMATEYMHIDHPEPVGKGESPLAPVDWPESPRAEHQLAPRVRLTFYIILDYAALTSISLY